jgi:hypothetical protein
MDSSMLPYGMQSRIDSEMESGERLVWCGQPLPIRFAMKALPLALFGLPFTAFAIVWMVVSGAFLGGGGQGGMMNLFSCFPLFGLPFVAVGLGLISAPYWAARRARKTLYALSGRRAILWSVGWWGTITVRNYPGDELKNMTRTERPDGAGDLVFEEITTVSHSHNHGTSIRRQQRGFLGVENVRELDRLIRETLKLE